MKYIIFYFDNKVTRLYSKVGLEAEAEAAEVEVETDGKKPDENYEISSISNIVYKNDILLKVIDVPTTDLIPKYIDKEYPYYKVMPFFKFSIGDGIFHDEQNHSYRTNEYGFVILDNTKTVRLVSPILINKDKTVVDLVVVPSRIKTLPTYNEISEILSENHIIATLNRQDIETAIEKINIDERKVSLIKVAESKKPINGRKEYYLPLIDIHRKAGKVKSDGRIDFKEVDSIIQVNKGQEILERYPEIFPQDGYDVYGEKIKAIIEPLKGYNRGENIVQGYGNDKIFVAAIDGCINTIKRSIVVKPQAVINGDVDYDSGNIDFNGTVIVKGSVLPGFKVKASGDIIIEQNIDDSELNAMGNVVVKMGIAGKGSSRVKAGGTIKAKYILNSKIQATGSIEVSDSIINSSVFSNDTIFVTSEHGTIMGGNIIARHVVDVNFIGSPKETPTTVTVGRNLDVEKELQLIRNEIVETKQKVSAIMANIKNSFGSYLFENPKEFISKLPEVKKKQCLTLLGDLSNFNNELKKLAVKGMQTEDKLVLDQPPKIIVHNKIFRGSVIAIKKNVKKIESEIQNAAFYEDETDKVIRFTPASS